MPSTAEKIITEQSVEIDIDTVKPYRKNPRVGNVAAIQDSLRENGQFRPIVVNKRTGEILGGNHTWKAAKAEGWKKVSAVYVDVDDDAAARIVLADNRTNDLATYNADLLAEVLAGLDAPTGTGYSQEDYDSLVKAVATQSTPEITDILRPAPIPAQVDDGGFVPSDNGAPPVLGNPEASFSDDDGISSDLPTPPKVDDGPEDLRDELGELQGILQLKEDMIFKGTNYYEIPDLVPSRLVQKLPTPLDTWAGEEATPDDGKTWWIWNYGVAPRKGLPMDRAILCFYTYDTYFESFWENPAFMTAKVINAGIKYAIVPDYSFYTEMTTATWIFNTMRAQWIGRYFQEAGIQVIPRIQFAIDKIPSASLDFNVFGIPKNAPVVAKCSHNTSDKDEFKADAYGLTKSLEKIQPKQLLMYGGNPALRLLEEVKPVERGLCDEVVHVYNYAHKRRGVVFDKKEGLAARKKDKTRDKRDKGGEDTGGLPVVNKADESAEL